MYDENGSPFAMSVKDANSGTVKTYYYEKNLQGDIVGIMNEAGYKVVNYTYDAWGNPYSPVYVYHSGVSATDRDNVELNPFRYRGYYYDSETGYYYLQTRYYNPEWGRFLNADGYINANGDILGYNMFAYCGNNPVMGIDPSGTSVTATFTVMLGFAALAFLVFTTCTMIAMMSTQSIATTYPNTFDNPFERDDPFERDKPLGRSRIKEKVTVRDSTKDVTKNKDDSQSYNYWAAEIVDNQVFPIKPLTYSEARAWVDCGHNLLCRDHASAIAIVKFYPSARYDHKHKDEGGYLNHYHLSSAHQNHIWFYGE